MRSERAGPGAALRAARRSTVCALTGPVFETLELLSLIGASGVGRFSSPVAGRGAGANPAASAPGGQPTRRISRGRRPKS